MLKASFIMVDWVNQKTAPVSMESMRTQLYAVIDRVVLGWSYEYMLPKEDPSEDEDGNKTYDASLMCLPIDDMNELEEAVQPHMDKLQRGPKATGRRSSSSNGSSRARVPNSRRG